MPADHRLPYNIEDAIERIFDRDDYLEFQPNHAPELLCADAKLFGRPVALVANRRGFLKTESGPRIGGIVYAESARKVAYFVENAERNGVPLIYLQDVSGFMVGVEAERDGIIRAGAEMVETHGVRHGAEDCADAESCQRRRILRHGGAGIRSDLHVRLADGAHRSDGGRFGGASDPWSGAGKVEGRGAAGSEGSAGPDRTDTRGLRALAGCPPRGGAGHVDALIDPLQTRRVLAFALEIATAHLHREHLVIETIAQSLERLKIRMIAKRAARKRDDQTQ